VDSLSKREKPKARKLPKNAPRTHRQVHQERAGAHFSRQNAIKLRSENAVLGGMTN